jgi:hypothetical protein
MRPIGDFRISDIASMIVVAFILVPTLVGNEDRTTLISGEHAARGPSERPPHERINNH